MRKNDNLCLCQNCRTLGKCNMVNCTDALIYCALNILVYRLHTYIMHRPQPAPLCDGSTHLHDMAQRAFYWLTWYGTESLLLTYMIWHREPTTYTIWHREPSTYTIWHREPSTYMRWHIEPWREPTCRRLSPPSQQAMAVRSLRVPSLGSTGYFVRGLQWVPRLATGYLRSYSAAVHPVPCSLQSYGSLCARNTNILRLCVQNHN